jgi:putative hemolysin
MNPLMRRLWAPCIAVTIASGAMPAVARAQTPIDVPTISTVPPRDDDGAAPLATPAVPPWDLALAPWDASPGELAAVVEPVTTRSSTTAAFTGSAAPLACRKAGYRMIIDERSDISLGTLCPMPDGSWRLLP